MDTIDVQNRSFAVRWLKVSQGDLVSFKLKPLKKSIGFGIYRRIDSPSNLDLNDVDDSSEGTKLVPGANSTPLAIKYSKDKKSSASIPDTYKEKNVPLQTRLSQSGLEKVTWYGTISNHDTVAESFESTCESCYYAFILDNTSSKQTKKKCNFSVSVKAANTRAIPVDDDNESIISNPDDDFNVYAINAKKNLSHSQSSLITSNGIGSKPLSMSATGCSAANMSPKAVKPLSPTSTATDLDLKNGRIFQGYLLKKKRKKLQGFSKRFFKLDTKFGILSYYLNSKSSVCRGEIVMPLSSISANKQTKLIIIDSGMEIWVMKARNVKEWELWISMIEQCFKQEQPTTSQDHGSHTTMGGVKASSTSKQHDTATTLFLRNLTSLRRKIEECKYQSLSFNQQPLPSPVTAPLGSQSAQKQQRNVSRSSSVSSFMNTFSRQKGGSAAADSAYQNSDTSTSILSNSNDLQQPHELYRKLAEIEKLAKQLDLDANFLVEQRIQKSPAASIFSEDEYFDAQEEPIITMLNDDVAYETDVMPVYTSFNEEDEDEDGLEAEPEAELESEEQDIDREISFKDTEGTDLSPLPISFTVQRRDDIPPPTTSPPSLLGLLRKNVGKDLTSISMPISINEPVSILQVLSESFEYAWLLNKAASLPVAEEVERMKYVSAFALSYLSIHRQKTRALRKPFTPLLGETFELVREDMGIRLISEKVCHKPPVFAFHAEHKDWKCSYTVTPVQKFWGKSIEFTNEGQFEVVFHNTEDTRYRWAQPTMVLKNIIAGERYMEPTNEFSVFASSGTAVKSSVIAFKAGGMFSGRSEDVEVRILGDKGHRLGSLKGQWTKELLDTDTGCTVWSCGSLVPQSEQKFGFTLFTANLNEITPIEKDRLPPTDSRLRPDIRLHEQGRSEEGEKWKLTLEQKQRERRDKGQDVAPQYFRQLKPHKWVAITGPDGYWSRRKRQDWSNTGPLW